MRFRDHTNMDVHLFMSASNAAGALTRLLVFASEQMLMNIKLVTANSEPWGVCVLGPRFTCPRQRSFFL